MISEYGGDFKLVLDLPHLPYRPGDNVSGAILKVPPNENIERIQILLTGEVKYVINPNGGGHGTQKEYTALVLSRTFDVFQNASREWRFEIAIPTTTERNSESGNSYMQLSASQAESLHFATDDEHPLPPTKPYDVAEEGSSIHTSSVVYGIRPCAVKQQGVDQLVRIVRPMLMLWITPLCAPTEIEPAGAMGSKVTETISVPNKNAKKGADNITIAPTFDFEIAVSAPPYLHVGDEFNVGIDVALQHPEEQDTAQAQIPVSLLELHVLINCTWSAYGDKLTHLNNLTPAQWQPVSKKDAHAFPDFGPASPDAHFNAVLSPLGHYVIPDFKTFHLATAHELYILAVFLCNKQKKVVKASLPIRILPKPRRPTDEGETKGFAGGPQDVKEDWGTVVLYPAAALPLVEPGEDEDPLLGVFDAAHTTLEFANVASNSCACCGVM